MLLKLCAPYGWGGNVSFCCDVVGLSSMCILLYDSGEEDGNCSEEMLAVKYSTTVGTYCVYYNTV